MKKFFLLTVAWLPLVAAQAFGLGLGAELNAPFSTSGVGSGLAATFKLDKVPYVFGLGVSGTSSGVHVGATADDWMVEGHLVDLLNWYAGPGLFVDLTSGGGSSLDAGVRVPVGINAFFFNKKLETFFELAPALGIALGPVQFPTLGLQNALGFRFWF